METLGLSQGTPKSRNWLLDLLWPRLTNPVEADDALRNGMYVCFACAILTALLALVAGFAFIFVAVYLVFLGTGVRAGSRLAVLTAFGYYALSFATNMVKSNIAMFNPIVEIIVMALLLGSVRASFHLRAERRRIATSELPPELPESAYYENAPPELVAMAQRDRGFEERVKKIWKATSPMPQILVGFSWCFIFVGVLAATVVTFYALPTRSMEPTLQIGDQLISLNYPFAGSIRRGDAVAFRMPYGNKTMTVKRVVALPGDRVQVRSNHLILNGRPTFEPYTQVLPGFPVSDFPADSLPPLFTPELTEKRNYMYGRDIRNDEYIVPANSYFMLGDNRSNSLDSRYFGAVSRSSLIGRIIHVYGNLKRKSTGATQLLRFPLGAS